MCIRIVQIIPPLRLTGRVKCSHNKEIHLIESVLILAGVIKIKLAVVGSPNETDTFITGKVEDTVLRQRPLKTHSAGNAITVVAGVNHLQSDVLSNDCRHAMFLLSPGCFI
ncbi:hypothetical protein J6590_022909 [Homalodisca vitripennis]|nr:hypothetical protein J6590_022909 [Homalodisca vitripennis]